MIPAEYKDRLAPFMATPPTDVLGAARALGLEVFATPLPKGVSGVLTKNPDLNTKSGFVIFVDKDEPVKRQRFTAAHEIGHYILHRASIGDRLEDNYLLRAQGMSSWQETEANKFAAELLMPWDAINRAMEQGKSSLEDLADHFKVSRLAMGIRLGLPT